MRYLWLFILLALPMLTHSALAQDLFIKKHESAEPEKQIQKDPKLQAPDTPAPLSRKELANNYYENCKRQDHPIMVGETKTMFCACTAAQLSQAMSADEIRMMYTDTKEGEYQRTRMTALVYVPCIQFPIRSLVENNCHTAPNIKGKFKNARKVCGCIGDGMGQYVAETGPKIIEREIAQNGDESLDVTKLLNTLMDSSGFQSQSQYYAASCVKKHEFGW